ncbi:MAG: hypothetical protein ABIF71_13320 [Planctomycetota bacterium]
MTGRTPRPRREIDDEHFRRGLPPKFLKETLAHRAGSEQEWQQVRARRRKQAFAFGLVGGLWAVLLTWAALNAHMSGTARPRWLPSALRAPSASPCGGWATCWPWPSTACPW